MQYIQMNIPELEKEMGRLQRQQIGEEATQTHLMRQFIRYGKYQKFSKDPEFIKRCENAKMIIATKLMSGGR